MSKLTQSAVEKVTKRLKGRQVIHTDITTEKVVVWYMNDENKIEKDEENIDYGVSMMNITSALAVLNQGR